MDGRCKQWDGQQCRATKDLTTCVMSIKQGAFLRGPEKVVVDLCPRHFQLLISNKKKAALGIKDSDSVKQRPSDTAHANRLEGILTGATREETAENLFAVTKGRMNTRSVYILADELMQAARTAPKEDSNGI